MPPSQALTMGGQPAARLRARLYDVLDTVRAVGAGGLVSEVPRWLLRREFSSWLVTCATHEHLPELLPPISGSRSSPRTSEGQRIGAFGAALANRRGLERGLLHRLGLVARWNRHVVRYNLAIGASPYGTVGYWQAVVRRLYFATGHVQIEGDRIRVAYS